MDVNELSRGTAEQLYLSLRFGYIQEINKCAVPLPIIIDDIFVNFDPERFSSACNIIREISKTNQILYFTCHPDTVKQLITSIPEARTFNLG
ncbi:MAG: hypothetical protein Q7J68_02060 [Thermoplasmata archaeon]|nr:hypothetical protein [Thermoplasmata archaeon]